MARRAGCVAVAVMLLAGCGSSGGDKASPLRPASEVERDRAKAGAFGQRIDLADGLTITVEEPAVRGTPEQPRLAMNVRFENATGEDVPAPNINTMCAGDRERRIGAYMVGSTYEPGQSTPAKSYAEGRFESVPTDAPSDCPMPAVVAITGNGFDEVQIPVPGELIARYNTLAG